MPKSNDILFAQQSSPNPTQPILSHQLHQQQQQQQPQEQPWAHLSQVPEQRRILLNTDQRAVVVALPHGLSDSSSFAGHEPGKRGVAQLSTIGSCLRAGWPTSGHSVGIRVKTIMIIIFINH